MGTRYGGSKLSVGPREPFGEEELLQALSLVQVGLDPEAAPVADQVLGKGEHAVDVELVGRPG